MSLAQGRVLGEYVDLQSGASSFPQCGRPDHRTVGGPTLRSLPVHSGPYQPLAQSMGSISLRYHYHKSFPRTTIKC